MKISVLHWAVMIIGVIVIIVESIALYQAKQELKEKNAVIASLQAAA